MRVHIQSELNRCVAETLRHDFRVHSGGQQQCRMRVSNAVEIEPLVDELRREICKWLHDYNYERPHQALAWLTPAEKRAQNVGVPDAEPLLRLVA